MTIHRNLNTRPDLKATVMIHQIQLNADDTYTISGWCMNVLKDDLLHIDMDVFKVKDIIEVRDHKGIFDKEAYYIPAVYEQKKTADPNEVKIIKQQGWWVYKETEQNKNSFFRAICEVCKLPETDDFYKVTNPKIQN